MKATLPLDGELVLRCHECGRPSTRDVTGTSKWTVVRVRPGAMLLVDVCPDCHSPQKPPIATRTP